MTQSAAQIRYASEYYGLGRGDESPQKINAIPTPFIIVLCHYKGANKL